MYKYILAIYIIVFMTSRHFTLHPQIRWVTPTPSFSWSVRRAGAGDMQSRSMPESLFTEMPVFAAHSAGVAAQPGTLSSCREQPRIVVVVLQTATPEVHS